MITTLIAVALLIQFIGVYALLVSVQQEQEATRQVVVMAEISGHQACYDDFACSPAGQPMNHSAGQPIH